MFKEKKKEKDSISLTYPKWEIKTDFPFYFLFLHCKNLFVERYKKRLDKWNNNHIDPIWLNKVFLRKVLSKNIFIFSGLLNLIMALEKLFEKFGDKILYINWCGTFHQHWLHIFFIFQRNWRARKNVFFSEDLVIFMLTWHQGVHLMKLDRVENEINVSFYSLCMATKIHC